MKVTNFLLIFGLFLLANATQVSYEFASFAEVSDIANSQYGKSLVETISLSLKNGGNIQTVQKLLDSLLFKLNQDQVKADNAWAKESERLLTKIKRLAKEIKDLKEEIRKLKVERERYLKLIEKVIANLKQYKAQLASDREQVNFLRKKRAEDLADFKRSQAEHMDIINAIDVVIKELNRLVGSISGKGRPVHVQEIAQEKRDREYAVKHHGFVELKEKLQKSFLEISKDEQETLEFIQMATEADQNSLHKLIALLRKLKNSTEKSFNDDKEAEAKSDKTFRRLIQALNSDIKKLVTMILVSEKHLKEYRAKVAKLTVEINAKTTLMNNKIKEKKATEHEYTIKKHQYEQEKKERAEEIVIVRKLQKIVETRLANMSKYLQDASQN